MDTKWFKQWKKYVGFDNWDTSYVGDQSANPGPIDNSPLLKGTPFFNIVVASTHEYGRNLYSSLTCYDERSNIVFVFQKEQKTNSKNI